MSDERFLWGNIALPVIIEALGGFDGAAPAVGDGEVYGVSLHFEYDKFATATIFYHDGTPEAFQCEEVRQLPILGTNVISAALGAPRGLQAITIDIERDMFTVVNCRYAPIDTSLGVFVAALKVLEPA